MGLTKSQKLEKLQRDMERLEQQKKELQRQQRQLQREEAAKQRKERTRRLIEVGGLVELAGIGLVNKSVLLGAMAELNEVIASDPEAVAKFRAAGEAIMAERQKQKQQKSQSDTEEIDDEHMD